MRILLSLLLAATASMSLYAQDGGKKGGAKAPPKNLQILPADNYMPAMRSFTAALGVQCDFCHVADRSSDEKDEKKMARNMLKMVADINSKFPDGKQHVTCFTCHRGAQMPLTAPPAADAKQ